MTSLNSLERRIAKLETKLTDDGPLIIERVLVEAGMFDDHGRLKQTLFFRRTPGKESEYF
jgi:hypothetical protein